MKEKLISVWLRKDVFYLQAYSETTDGLWISSYNPVHTVKIEDVSTLGFVVIQILDESKTGLVPLSLEESAIKRKEFLSVVGVKSEKVLMSTGKTVTISFREQKVTIKPYKYTGKYLEPEDDKIIESILDPDQLQKDVLKAFEI